VTISVSKEATAIVDHSWDALMDALTSNGAKLADDKLFRIGYGQLIDKHIVDDQVKV
jgi:hypothetical protein